MTSIYATETLEVHQCGKCGVSFAMPTTFTAEKRENGEAFYCPNGHARVFRESEATRLRRQLDQAKKRQEWAEGREMHQRDQREAAERSNAALRGVITKQKKRAAAGVCQCCQRTFQNVADHMRTQHPDYVEGVAR
ncbi:hypothetical protein VSH64_25015 [Amycolatopsis rhabdoformis]|uniref:C2H2-type domain-containing protein n=1 Tax=Amycolatopsis rhabdoformis TaxID=1448059 RepID=A0ABZ1HW68_9PSEU|nr:hypothetical protein [Amycolatopsis rhabdoformis]WSE26139.1 hypothetical protein VSH64_25015 [Amycolatopsis rhabdoformis]